MINTYYCINNGFDARLKIDYTTEYILKPGGTRNYPFKVGYYTIYVIDGNKQMNVGNFELSAYQDFDDYFISKADWRAKQIDSILEE
jgi:hypothetical protein